MEVRNPIYSNADNTSIDVELDHPEYGWIPFTATPNDTEQHGRDIYAAAKRGDYGQVAPYDGPSEEEMLEQQMRARRDSLLAEVDTISTNPLIWNGLTEAQQQAWADYRRALLDVPQQSGFPQDVDWPEAPNA